MHKLGFISLLLVNAITLFAASSGSTISQEAPAFCAYSCPYLKTHAFHAFCHKKYVEERLAGELDSLEAFKKRTGFCLFCSESAKAKCQLPCEWCYISKTP